MCVSVNWIRIGFRSIKQLHLGHLVVFINLRSDVNWLVLATDSKQGEKEFRIEAALWISPALYVFGDSTVDPGNNNNLKNGLKVNFLPYGVDFNNNPTGRFTNGKTAADFLAILMKLPIPPAYQNMTELERKTTFHGINFGSGGCGVFPTTKPSGLECFPLEPQINFFNTTIVEDMPYLIPLPIARSLHLSLSIFFISVGANDYLLSNSTSMKRDPDEFAANLLQQLRTNLERLYHIGARRYVVNNIGPLGCLPSLLNITTGQCNLDSNQLATSYVSQLPGMLKGMQLEFPDAHFILADSFSLFNQMLLYPGQYGFNEIKKPCCGTYTIGRGWDCKPGSTPCGNRDQYLFFDGAHSSQAANLVFAQYCINGKICSKI